MLPATIATKQLVADHAIFRAGADDDVVQSAGRLLRRLAQLGQDVFDSPTIAQIGGPGFGDTHAEQRRKSADGPIQARSSSAAGRSTLA